MGMFGVGFRMRSDVSASLQAFCMYLIIQPLCTISLRFSTFIMLYVRLYMTVFAIRALPTRLFYVSLPESHGMLASIIITDTCWYDFRRAGDSL